ncbi:unnamed protein product [Trifolium pratense]|uniref:Uncharacterized protein n=1 Tax=Trifolium pratense TaxID=57577 RepID=A0ACB0LMM8_TRIPR|nr:unnamed protein product [Trifolium pratense]
MGAYLSKEHVSVKLFIDEEKNKVLFVQAGKDFLDVLLSFLTLPLGTIARLVSKNSNIQKVRVGSISSLYDSVVNLDEKQFWTPVCKEMLLRPRNSMEEYCQRIKLNIDDTEKMKYFVCENQNCSRESGALLSTFRNQKCKCGKPMNREIFLASSCTNEKVDYEGFVPDTASFIISDDLSVKPDTLSGTIFKPINLPESCNLDAIKQVTINVTRKEILDLLKCSLFSMTPLTHVFLKKNLVIENRNTQSISSFDTDCRDQKSKSREKKISVKLLVRKSSNTVLFALGGEDFADFVISLLTFPLGGVEYMLNGKSYMGSIDNLYQSISVLDHCNYLRSPDLVDKLNKSRLAHQFKICNQILPIDEASAFNYACYSKKEMYGEVRSSLVASNGCSWSFFDTCVHLEYLEPQSSTGEAYNRFAIGGRGFTKKPALYMVSDDLIVTPGSSTSAISVLTKLRIPLSDVVECDIDIGKNESLSIVKASLISSSALTNGFGPFLTKFT